jgi:5'-nucleotidase
VRRISPFVPVLVVALAAVLAGCGGDEDPAILADSADTTATTTPSTTTTAPPEPLRILLVNDDGMENPAIDVMVEELLAVDDVEVTVVAPAGERSGSSDQTTPGGAPYHRATTPGGIEGWAVDGFPADAVVVGLDELDFEPHLVLSGVNPGQNVGPFAAISGTVGVGRTAIRRQVPALAVSAGLQLDQEQFVYAARLALDWIAEHRDALLDGSHQTDTVTSINVPACPVDSMGPLQVVPRASELAEDVKPFESSCDQAVAAPETDVAAIVSGYPSISQVPADL